jgi:subtilisin family serine protease
MSVWRALTIALLLGAAGCASQAQREARAVQAAPWLAPSNQPLVIVTVRNTQMPGARAGSTARDYDVAQAYGASPQARSEVRTLAKRYGLRLVNAWPIEVLNVHCVVYATPSTLDQSALIERLRADRQVESVQPLNSFATLATSVGAYSDPYFNLQSNLQVLQVPQAQRISRGAGVRVAIIDTGVDATHPELAGRVAVQRNYVGGLSVDTSERHGTAVAGVIAAVDNNRQGIVGIAPAAQLLSLRACWPAGTNDARSLCNTFTLAQALAAAIELRADVVNLSLGGPADPLLNRLVAAGIQKGIVYVGAISPSAASVGPMFPTSITGVIAVNNAGADRTSKNDSLFAPGANILTLTPLGGYDFMSGSSLALLLSHRRGLRRDALYAALAKSARAEGVDFCAAMTALDANASCAGE